jgi:hypothetical protein
VNILFSPFGYNHRWESAFRIAYVLNVENLLTIWDPSVALHENPRLTLILDLYLLALQLIQHGVLHGMCWNELCMGQNGTRWPQNSKMAASYNC